MRKFGPYLILIILATAMIPGALTSASDALYAQCLATPNQNGCRAGLPVARYQVLLDEMLFNPEPDVRQIPVNDAELRRFAFRRLNNPNGTTIYNAPGGQPVGGMEAGFTYVTVEGYEPGWVKINDGQWVQESDTTVARPSEFAGVLLPEELKYPMAWVLIPSYPAPYPGAEGDATRPRIERYTRVNIFEAVEVEGWRWYLVGPDAWIKQTLVAKTIFIDRPEQVKGRWVAIDLYEQILVAYDNDTPVYTSLISSGLPEWATNEGTFRTWVRLANGGMSGAEGQTDFYSLENVPWTLYYDGSISIHGTYWHDGFGYRHSHGCVNMTITDAHWVYQWTLDGGIDKPWVHVFSSGEYNDS